MKTQNIVLRLGDAAITFSAKEIPNTDKLGEYSFRCVDGRYSIEDAMNGIIAFPGATAGLFAVLLATLRTLGNDAQYTVDDVLHAFIKLLGGLDHINLHTDDHNLHSQSLHATGCGHVKLIRNNKEKYLLQNEDLECLNKLIHDTTEKHPEQEIVLEGGHEERLVILVRGAVALTSKGIGENNQQIQSFIFNEYSLEILKHVAQHMIEKEYITFVDEEISADDFAGMLAEMAALHLSLTVSTLAGNLPIYRIDFAKSETKPEITSLGELGAEGKVTVQALFY